MKKVLNQTRNNFYKEVYRLVCQVPPGKVTTYGTIARVLSYRDVRRIGWALHANKDSLIPCHRVVNRHGRIAPNFAFSGEDVQRRRLLSENITFTDAAHVDLDRHLYTFTLK